MPWSSCKEEAMMDFSYNYPPGQLTATDTFITPYQGLPAFHEDWAPLDRIPGTSPSNEASGYAAREVMGINARVEELEALNHQLLLYIVRQNKQGPGAQTLSSIALQTNTLLQTCAKQAEGIDAMKSLLDAKDKEIKQLNREKEDYHLPCNERLARYESLLRQARCDYDALADAAKEDETQANQVIGALKFWVNLWLKSSMEKGAELGRRAHSVERRRRLGKYGLI